MKKGLCILLAAVLVCGLSLTAFAASKKITGVSDTFADDDYTEMTVSPGKVIEIPLTADMFDWSDGNGGSDDPVSISQLNTGKITLKVSYDTNSKKIVKDVDFKLKTSSATAGDKTAHVRIEFLEDYVSTDELEFEFTVYLAYKNTRVKDSGVTFSGTFQNTVLLVDDEEEDYLDISEGAVIESEAYIKSIDLHLGEGLYINTKLYEGRQYFGKAERGVKEEDYKVVDAYPEIDTVYTLNTVNLSGGKVYFELDSKYYVYDSDGRYAGTTEEELKYSDKYYLASTKINLNGNSSSNSNVTDDDDDEVIPVEDDDEVPVIESNSGSYINDNPGTGMGGVISGAVMLAVVSASVMTLVVRKKRQ